MPPPLPLWTAGGYITVLARTQHLQPLVPCTFTWDQSHCHYYPSYHDDDVGGSGSSGGGGRFVVNLQNQYVPSYPVRYVPCTPDGTAVYA